MHSQSQTIQEPFSAELTPVRLHPAVQFPVEERRQVAAAPAGQKAAPPTPHTPAGLHSHSQRWEQEESHPTLILGHSLPVPPMSMDCCTHS